MALNCDQRYKWKFLFLRNMMRTKRTSINNAFVVIDFLQSMSYFWWNSFLKHDQPISFCNFIVFNFTSQAETGNSALFLSLLQGWPRPGPCFLFVTTLCVVIMMLTTIYNDKNDKRTWSQGLLSWTNLWDGRERVRCSRKAFQVTDYCFHFLKKKTTTITMTTKTTSWNKTIGEEVVPLECIMWILFREFQWLMWPLPAE